MKKVLLLAITIMLISCGNKADFTKVKVGMTSKQLIEAVGEPNQKQDLPFVGSYWTYDTHLVVVQSDTVNEFLTNEDFKKRMEEVNKGLEELNKSIE
jgi:hypothetical protein